MSINPVPNFGAQDVADSDDARALRSQPSSSQQAQDFERESKVGARASQESEPAQKAIAGQQQPQDVVQVQTDSQLENQIVIKYMDHASGRTILQVPSSEVLSVALGISEDLKQDLKAEAGTAAASVEGGKHGH